MTDTLIVDEQTGRIVPSDTQPWWKSAVVYQIYPRSFADSDGDGIGDLRGIIGRLNYLERLGVDVVWLSPFYTSPMYDNGYDISDYQDVDPSFGTLADLDELIEQLHQRNMKLMIDVVVNHTSDQHPWFVESRSSADNPKRDWYWWRPARNGAALAGCGDEPTNWESFFSGPAWSLDPVTGEYYLHLFSPHQPDLNWENPQVRQTIYTMLNWWLGRGVDGFRFDVINMISKRLPLEDGTPVRPDGLGDGTPHYLNGPRVHEFLHELNTAVLAGRRPPILTVGETPGIGVGDGLTISDPANAELDMVFQFEHVGLDHGPQGKYDPAPINLRELKASFQRWQTGLAERGWNSLYWNNHDQPRAVSRFGCDNEQYRELSAKLLATVLHMHRGTPFIFQGEELGMTNFPFAAIEDYRDIEAINHYRERTHAGAAEADVLAGLTHGGRDNSRTPMQWDAGPGAGFSTGVPWLSVNPNHLEVNASSQVGDPRSVYEHYRTLIRLRHQIPAIAHGTFTMRLEKHPQIYAFTRHLDGQQILVVANFASGEASAAIEPSWSDSQLVLSNYADSEPPSAQSNSGRGKPSSGPYRPTVDSPSPSRSRRWWPRTFPGHLGTAVLDPSDLHRIRPTLNNCRSLSVGRRRHTDTEMSVAQQVESFESFARQQLPRLLRFADVLTGEHQLAEDIVQDVLLRTHQRWDHIGSLDLPVSYVRRMVVNDFLSWRRRLARVPPRIILEDLAVIPDGADYTAIHAERAELAIRLRALPPKQRAAVVMRFYADLPDEEIASALRCTQGTVRSHISRALATLRISAELPVLTHKEA